MEFAATLAFFALGLFCIVKGGDYFVDAAVWMAEVSGLPRFLVGATVVSLGTTLPELMVSAMGVLAGEVDMAVGNAVGSVTANIGLILGISLLCLPGPIRRRQFVPRAGLMVLAAVLLWALCRSGRLLVLPGLLLLVVFALFVRLSIREAVQSAGRQLGRSGKALSRRRVAVMLGKFGLGLAGILLGSRLLIHTGGDIALLLGVPAGLVGVTLVAVGTSLPELVTTVAALLKGEGAMSVGNIIGANVIDLTLILPFCAFLSGGGLEISPQTIGRDIPVCLLMAVVAVVPPILAKRFFRWQGGVLLALYAGYLAILLG